MCVCVFIKGAPGRDGKDGIPGGIGLKVCTDLVLLTIKKFIGFLELRTWTIENIWQVHFEEATQDAVLFDRTA